MQKLKKKIFYLFIFSFFIIGSLTSLNVGISHDEWHEEENWKYNVNLSQNLINELFLDKENDFNSDEYKDKYYGIGFQIISQPIQHVIKNILLKYQNINEFGAKLVSKHFVVFLFFFISGLCFYSILKKIVKDRNFCYFALLIYFFYPYLFGQSLFSPKDIPFMSGWIICTLISFNIFEKLLKNKDLRYTKIILFALSTAFLLSIRVTGVLILLQYLITFIIFINLDKISFINFLKKFFFKFFIFIFFTLFFIYIFYPLYWNNPLTIINAIKWMGHYYHDVCTNTLGTCMNAKNLPPTYIPIWLSVKLPLIIIFGIFLIPLAEKKIFSNDKRNLVFGTILIVSVCIPLILIFRKVHLYDEVRHIMFLMPFFFMLGTVSLHMYSKKIFYILGVITLSIFIVENIKIHPYQYVWFNLPSRFLDLSNKFELDYQGISGKNIAEKISEMDSKNLCILTSPIYSVEPFLNKKKFNCFDRWQLIDTDYKRPFIAVQHVRNIKKGMPYNCKSIHDEGFKLLFHSKKFITGKILKCF